MRGRSTTHLFSTADSLPSDLHSYLGGSVSGQRTLCDAYPDLDSDFYPDANSNKYPNPNGNADPGAQRLLRVRPVLRGPNFRGLPWGLFRCVQRRVHDDGGHLKLRHVYAYPDHDAHHDTHRDSNVHADPDLDRDSNAYTDANADVDKHPKRDANSNADVDAYADSNPRAERLLPMQ